MVHGLEKFKEYFEDHTNQYVFIGGTACDILMGELGVPFRATKDLDIVLIIEKLDISFGEIFWKFIEDVGYEHHEKSTGENQFYRFSKPNRSEYPAMIELFSRKSDDFNLKFETGLTPIHLDESIISLSAILLNDVYYDSLMRSMQTIDGYSVIEIETMILFKIKAWLDLKERFERGEHVDSKNIKKHKNDIFRLLTNVVPSKRVEIAREIEEDIKIFIEKINVDKPDLKYLEITNASVYDLLEILKNLYTIKHEEI